MTCHWVHDGHASSVIQKGWLRTILDQCDPLKRCGSLNYENVNVASGGKDEVRIKGESIVWTEEESADSRDFRD